MILERREFKILRNRQTTLGGTKDNGLEWGSQIPKVLVMVITKKHQKVEQLENSTGTMYIKGP